MVVCVHDANILIDLAKSGLLDAYARLGWKTHVPDMVLREVREEIGIWLERGLFQIESFQAEELEKIVLLLTSHSRRISLPDASALHLARRLAVPLLTGDGALRKAAERDGLECHGLLWILDHLHQAGTPPRTLLDGLDAALASGARLPMEECARRIRRWNSE